MSVDLGRSFFPSLASEHHDDHSLMANKLLLFCLVDMFVSYYRGAKECGSRSRPESQTLTTRLWLAFELLSIAPWLLSGLD